jgi:hypothetical protein
MKKSRHLLATSLACALAASPVMATDFTLSESAMMSLDYNNSASFGMPLTSSILTNQDIPRIGVQYTIRFVSTNLLTSTFFHLSDSRHGAGTLAGADVSAYKKFALKFTLIAIDGSTSASNALVVGAMVGPSGGYPNAFRPEVIGLTGSYPPSATSVTTSDPGIIRVIGFTVYPIPSPAWVAGPHDITLLVQPADGAVPLEIPNAEHESAPRLP